MPVEGLQCVLSVVSAIPVHGGDINYLIRENKFNCVQMKFKFDLPVPVWTVIVCYLFAWKLMIHTVESVARWL